MTAPRSQLVPPDTPGFYHCVSRCVRRAFLCGVDDYSGASFEHRKAWVEDRILELGSIFAVGVYAYAVMSNHLHVVVRLDPLLAASWSDDDLAERWTRLFSVRVDGEINAEATRLKAETLAGNPARLAAVRERLASLSWFMRCLSEPIARRANREDGCTGRFWEGRFKCQALLDERAVLACMTYVDLNPVRAGVADDLASSAHTSIAKRLESTTSTMDQPLHPIRGTATSGPGLTTRQYLELVDWTGRQLVPGKRGAIIGETPKVLSRWEAREAEWRYQVLGIESRYWRAIGQVETLLAKAEEIGQRWLKGCGLHRRRSSATA